MVSHNREFSPPHNGLKAFAGIWTVADDVTETNEVVNVLARDICKNGLESLEVAVDITNQRLPHSCYLNRCMKKWCCFATEIYTNALSQTIERPNSGTIV
jgi:hypothetical protein